MTPRHRVGKGSSGARNPARWVPGSVSHTMTPDSGPTAGRPGLGFKLRSSDFLGLPRVAYAQDERVGLRSALLFCCAVFSRVMSIPNTRTRAPSSSAGSGGWWKQGSRLAFHSHAPPPPPSPAPGPGPASLWGRRPCPPVQAGPQRPRSPATQPELQLRLLLARQLHDQSGRGQCVPKRRCPLDPSFPAGSPCPSGCGSRPAS